ncbi:MAG: hypothetical protein ACREID_10185 [Planctomycetota bacterium]
MTTLFLIAAGLVLAQLASLRRARGDVTRLMRPAEDWDGQDVDRWLALIEPFPLRHPSKRS